MSDQKEQPAIQIVTQYVKDCSFENPHAPESLMAGWGAPETSVQIGVNHRQIKDNLYEAALSMRVEARNVKENKAAFIAEILYGALVALKGVPAENVAPVLSVEVPKLLFPFVRETIAGFTIKGGFPPLYLMPISFEALYLSELKRQQALAAGKGAASAG